MIPYGRHHLEEDDIVAVTEILKAGLLTQGPMIEAFETAVADYVGSRYAVAVSSCTAALHLAALSADIRPGRKLVTSPITFVASANAALYCGGTIAFCDIDPSTVNMDPNALEAVLAEADDVGVVSPVHFGGLPCDMERIGHLARKAGALVVEDAAHALGARYSDGSRVGSGTYGDMTAFSFHPVKAIAAGEGGMITTNDENLYRRLLRLRSHGINKLNDSMVGSDLAFENGKLNPWYYEMQELGHHYRITDIQCALALSQLKKLDRFLARRQQLAAVYDAAFSSFTNLSPAQPMARERSGLHIYVVRIDYAAAGISRGDLMRALRSRDIGSQVHYVPVPAHPYYRQRGFDPKSYGHAWKYYQDALSIPLFFDLTDAQQSDVITALQEIVG
ncbi:MAG: UDP-4-amino-4,6-dideoxy-N-acetyl-beta-L-altrosamine transaminase [Rhizobiales bacterium]|nr:UDP-4-amino-4,6-dideoxy-N-acetyl-beta-L-altrosamine transaminase [Hyphomicrobiales bacterium]MBO6698953.1 UDP-4-amino-4,6-dideoxy-N-acetyl-beta-L-altrosamine transaminase [Hyphomicrobiales bacterium]MBO6734794.1 UDP-4-amino-4,6-dideoxy-N-acetyl-beta-L-altrosamine transaminase [Hyphomicrobiales bacterium]MBO6911400.1 UDP-4-amino-4,6-dideoxy-N-acetyl-beta-L-altrosamine transaminase [Hyphomicrobiales bacterium]MBO6955467.1 UDP-4-amino-4,6-dideoxy-N-acetyl-beta-L-altrosamine transaminase [Hyphom